MLKKIGLPAIALLAMLSFAPHPAKAAVRFGVYVGGPVYTAPYYPPVVAPAPVVVAPGPVVVYGHRWVARHDFRRRW